MKIRKLSPELNIVTIIDDLIMELTFIRNGSIPSLQKLETGITLIDDILALQVNKNDELHENKLGFNIYKDYKYFSTEGLNPDVYQKDLQDIRENIKNLISHPKNINSIEVEKIQKILLQFSIPIWKTEISNLKSN